MRVARVYVAKHYPPGVFRISTCVVTEIEILLSHTPYVNNSIISCMLFKGL